MTTILLLLAVVGVSAAYLVAKGPQIMDDSGDPWDGAPAGYSGRRSHTPRSTANQPKGRHGDRRYHDADCPCHRRSTDGMGGES
jgi:hypothetical protein